MSLTFENFTSIVEILAVIIAGAALFVSVRNGTRARETEVTLRLFETLQNEWSESWGEIILNLESKTVAGLDDLSKSDQASLRRALNMLDWIGRLVRNGHLTQAKTLYGATGPAMLRTLRIAKPLIDADTERFGKDFWGGVVYLEAELERMPFASRL
ncbi:MAG: hypothetical protein AAF224_10925 [Pseudomonadota bacterium]